MPESDLFLIVVKGYLATCLALTEQVAGLYRDLGGNDRWSEEVGDTHLPAAVAALRHANEELARYGR